MRLAIVAEMHRRGPLRILALVGALTITAVSCTAGTGSSDKAGGPGEVVLRMASTSNDVSSQPPVAYFIHRVEQISHGGVRIEVANHWGNFSPDAEQQVVHAVSTGAVDLGWSGSRVFDTMGVNSFEALTAPMLIDSYALEQAVTRSDLPRQMLTGLAKLGVIGLGVLADGLRKPIAVEAPLLKPSDWRGITFQAFRSRGQAEAIRALGAQPADVFGHRLDLGLQSGEIQGFEKNLFVYKVNDTEGLAPYVTANVNLWPQMDVLFADLGRLSKLTMEQRGWLRQAAKDAAARSTALVERDGQLVAATCHFGTHFANATKPDLAALRRAFVPVYASLQQDPRTKSFIREILTLKESTRGDPAALAIPAGCSASSGSHPSRDAFAGTWQTSHITESEWVRAFIGGGGSEQLAHSSYRGYGAQRYEVTQLQLQNGTYTIAESADGGPPQVGARGPYRVSAHKITFIGTGFDGKQCLDTLRFTANGDHLQFRLVKPCAHDHFAAAYDKAFLGSFPFTRVK